MGFAFMSFLLISAGFLLSGCLGFYIGVTAAANRIADRTAQINRDINEGLKDLLSS